MACIEHTGTSKVASLNVLCHLNYLAFSYCRQDLHYMCCCSQSSCQKKHQCATMIHNECISTRWINDESDKGRGMPWLRKKLSDESSECTVIIGTNLESMLLLSGMIQVHTLLGYLPLVNMHGKGSCFIHHLHTRATQT